MSDNSLFFVNTVVLAIFIMFVVRSCTHHELYLEGCKRVASDQTIFENWECPEPAIEWKEHTHKLEAK